MSESAVRLVLDLGFVVSSGVAPEMADCAVRSIIVFGVMCEMTDCGNGLSIETRYSTHTR